MKSHKPLKSVSHNFGHSFVSLINYIKDDYFLGHLLRQARKTNINRLEVDLLHQSAGPAELLTGPIKDSINYWSKWFPVLVESSGSSMDFVSSAKVIIEFDLHQTRLFPHDNAYIENSYFCEVIIIDDRGKEYKKKQEGWWFPEI